MMRKILYPDNYPPRETQRMREMREITIEEPNPERGAESEDMRQVVVGHFGSVIADLLTAELLGYMERNKIPPPQVHAHVTMFRREPGVVDITLSHQVDGKPIIGAPKRHFTIEIRSYPPTTDSRPGRSLVRGKTK